MKHLVMKHLAFLSILGLAVTAVAAVPEKIPAVTFENVFDSDANHVQGACCSDDAVYLSQKTFLYKFGWDGTLLAKVAVTNHTGDICFLRVNTLTPHRCDDPGKKGVGASLSFFEFRDGAFVDITESPVNEQGHVRQ